MLPTRQGAIRLFRIAGIDVLLHWSWFVVAIYVIQTRLHAYSSPVWNIVEYLSLFVLVLLHEFGHALACRQVGGRAEEIILWPLGGVAYVAPPPRPGAQLWSIAAGPLVNLVLAVPLFLVLQFVPDEAGGSPLAQDAAEWLWTLFQIDLALLIFNLLPIYPLDGGQILRSLLWFAIGPIRSLLVAAAIGFPGAVAIGAYAFYARSPVLGLIALFVFLNCRRGWLYARELRRLEQAD